MKNKGVWIILGIVLIVAVIAGIYYSNQNKSVDSIKIGILTHQTGFGAIWGISEKNAAIMRIDELNVGKKNIEYFVEDCGSDIAICITAANKLISVDGVDAIVGPTWGEWYTAVAPIAEESGVLLISPSGTSSVKLGNFIYSTKQPDQELTKAAVNFLRERNVKNVVLLTTQNEYFYQLSSYFKDQGINLTIVEFELLPNTKDFRSVLIKVKEANPDAIMSNIIQTDEVNLVKQFKEAGMDKDILFLSSTASVHLFEQDNVAILRGIYYLDYTISSKFKSHYSEQYDDELGPSALSAYDSVSIIFEALSKKMIQLNDKEFRVFESSVMFDKNNNAVYVGPSLFEVKSI